MPTAPYAQIRVSLDGGGVQTGGIEATGGEVVHLSANPAGLVGATQYLWELLNFPPEFTEPAGWETDDSGNYYSTLQTPPPFTLLSDVYFDKYVPRLTLNGGGPALDRNATAAQIAAKEALVDVRTAIDVPHPSGIKQIAAYEGTQFSNKGWVGGLRETIRYLATLIGGGSTLPAPGTAGNVLTSNGSDWVSAGAGGYSITSFAQATSLYEVGTVLANPAFTAAHSVAPTALTLTNNKNGESKNVLSTPTAPSSSQSYTFDTPSYSVTFTLTGQNITSDTTTLTKTAAQKTHWGLSASPVATEAFIEALSNSALDTDAARTFTLSPGASEYICFAHPTRYGTPTFLIGGVLPGGYVSLGTTISVTNAQGYTENYTLWRSVTAGLAPNTSTTVQN